MTGGSYPRPDAAINSRPDRARRVVDTPECTLLPTFQLGCYRGNSKRVGLLATAAAIRALTRCRLRLRTAGAAATGCLFRQRAARGRVAELGSGAAAGRKSGCKRIDWQQGNKDKRDDALSDAAHIHSLEGGGAYEAVDRQTRLDPRRLLLARSSDYSARGRLKLKAKWRSLAANCFFQERQHPGEPRPRAASDSYRLERPRRKLRMAGDSAAAKSSAVRTLAVNAFTTN